MRQIRPNGSKRKSAEKLAAALLRDRERPASISTSTETCFACGRSHLRRPVSGDGNPRFCSTHCQDAFDAGLPPFNPNHDRVLGAVPLSGWLAGETRHYERILRGSKAWRRLAKSAEWTPVHKLKIRRKKPNKNNSLQGNFAGPTDLLIRSDWAPSDNIDPNHPDLAIPDFLDRRLRIESDRADASDEPTKQSRRAA
jgi:hypothetical protein